MFWIFILSLIVVTALFKLGAAMVMVSVLSTVLVVTVALLTCIALAGAWCLWRRRRR